jgi:hypothetical protein
MKPLSSIYTRHLPSRVFAFAAYGVLATLILAVPLFGQWEPDVRLTFDDSLSLMSMNNARCIAAGPNGAIHAVWHDTRDAGEYAEEVYYKRSTDCGTTWSADLRLSASDGYRSWRPSVCVEGSNVHVAWYDEHSGSPDIFYKLSNDGGLTWALEIPLGTGFQWPPSIAAYGSYIHVVWVAIGQNSHTEIRYNRSSDGGVSWSGAIKLTNPDSSQENDGLPSVSASGSNINVIWQRYNSTYNYNICFKHSSDQGVTWSQDENLLPWHLTLYPCHALSDSIIHVVWLDAVPSGQIYYKRSIDHGMTWLQEEQLSDSIYRTNFPTIAASGLNVHVVWEGTPEGYPGSNLYYKFSSDGGATWSAQSVLTTDTISGAGLYPSIAVGDTMVHMVWQDGRHGHPYTGNREIYYKRNPTGNALGINENSAGSMQQIPTGLIAFPNPFTSFTTISGYEKHSFVLYDITGKRVGTFRGDRIGQGLSAGVYFLRFDGNNAESVRIVKLR